MSHSIESLKIMRDELNSFPHNKSIIEWKDQGKKAIGWVCNYVPEEIVYAAGMLPIRIMSKETTISEGDDYLQSNMCPYIRGCLGLALDKQYDYLDGIIVAHCCDAVCRLFDNWRLYIEPKYSFMLDHPHKITDTAQKYHFKLLQNLKESLEKFSGIEITDNSLKNAIEIYNENRKLLKHIHNHLKNDKSPLSAIEISEIIRSSMIMPKDQHNKLLKDLIKDIDNIENQPKSQPRLMISGSIIDNTSFFQLIEECGAEVVTDDLCTGTRYFWDNINNGGNPLNDISVRYLNMAPCACIEPPYARFEYMFNMIEDYKVDGVILYGLMYCDTFQYDFVGQKNRLKEKNIPVIEVELEHPSSGLGQLRTRIQAFLEML